MQIQDSNQRSEGSSSPEIDRWGDFLEKLHHLAESQPETAKLLEEYSDLVVSSENRSIPKDEQVSWLNRIEALESELDELKKTNDSVVSDNYLLEFKKKELLLLANNLEDAYDEISRKNKEVQAQKDEILHKNEELIELNKEKSNLISIVAHDLKSPLNQIKGFISLIHLTDQNLNPEVVGYLNTIERSTDRLINMIMKILSSEARDDRSLNVHLQATNLTKLVDDCLLRFSIDADKKQIALLPEIDSSIFAHVDPDLFNQVLENLLSNALKFSPKGKEVTVRLFEEKDKAIMEVADNGPGISLEDRKKLFGKYQKLSARPTGNESSTGLGLSIVKKYVDNMDGDIRCESTVGKGATFRVEFDKASPSE